MPKQSPAQTGGPNEGEQVSQKDLPNELYGFLIGKSKTSWRVLRIAMDIAVKNKLYDQKTEAEVILKALVETPDDNNVKAALAIVLAHDNPKTQPPKIDQESVLAGLNADQLRALIKTSSTDIFTPLAKEGNFGTVLNSIVKDTIENAFNKILMESASAAVRKASLNLLRDTYVSIAKDGKPVNLNSLIETIVANHANKPGGGSGGDPDNKPDMP